VVKVMVVLKEVVVKVKAEAAANWNLLSCARRW
jgi:hypothetical protein